MLSSEVVKRRLRSNPYTRILLTVRVCKRYPPAVPTDNRLYRICLGLPGLDLLPNTGSFIQQLIFLL
jgi:hypothetical protein